jgi:hypothetical protein
LEERTRPAQKRTRSEAERYRDWRARQLISRNELTPPDVKHAREMIALFRIQGSLAGESAEQLLERIVSYPHDASGSGSKAGGRSLALIEAELWRAVYHGEERLEHMAGEMPDAWRESLAAGDVWRHRLTGMPVEAVARWVIANRALMERGSTGEEIVALAAKHMGPYGISEGLLERVAGPDRNVHDGEKAHWMIYAPVADALCSEWAWKVTEQVRKLDETGVN